MSDLNNTAAVAPTVKIEMSFTPHLATGETILPLAAYVTPVGFDKLAKGPAEAFVGLAVDVSGSMHAYIDDKNTRAGVKDDLMRSGGQAGLDALPATMYFAVYTIGQGGRRIFPASSGDAVMPVLATPANIAAAKKAVAALVANEGGTHFTPAMKMFRLDAELLRQQKGITTAVLGALTDGAFSDAGSVSRELGLGDTSGREQNYKTARASGLSLSILPFGIGLDWQPAQLTLLAESTLSPESAKLVMSELQVKESFQQVVEVGASQSLSNVKLFLKKREDIPVTSARVERPVSIDLTKEVRPGVEKNTVCIPLGAWDNETRLICVELGVTPTEGNLTACFLWFEYDIGNKTVKTDQQKVTCTWTSDEGLSSVIARGVDEGNLVQASKVRLRQAGQLAGGGNFEKAEALLSEQYRAAQKKKAAGVDVQAVFDMLLAQVDVVDEATGTVRMKDRSQAGAMKMEAESGQSKVRKRGGAV